MNPDLESRFYDLMESDLENPDIQYEIGRCYLYGEGVAQDGQQAQLWLGRAAAQGHLPARALLDSAQPAKENPGVLTPETLMDWCAAAEDGDPESQYQVAMYFAKEDSPQSANDVHRYLNMAVNQGHPLACLALGQRIRKQKPSEAEKLFHNAADCGVPEAYTILGEIASSRGETPIAEDYFEQGAQLGGAEAMLKLAIRFACGDCVSVSQGKAMTWLKRAQDAGLNNAQERYRQEMEKIRAQQEERARQQAEERRRREEERRQQEEERRKQEEERRRLNQEAANRQLEKAAEPKQEIVRNPVPATPQSAGGRRNPLMTIAALGVALCLVVLVGLGVLYLKGGSTADNPVDAVLSVTAESVDAFEEIHLTYMGMAPYGTVDIINNSPYSSLQCSSYTAEPQEGLSNGDTVTVTLNCNESSLLSDNIKVKETTKTYTVEGLTSYVMTADQIDEASLETMKSQAADMVESYLTNTERGKIADILVNRYSSLHYPIYGTPELATSYLLTLKQDFTGDYVNFYNLVYKVPTRLLYKEDPEDVRFDGFMYFAVAFYDLTQTAEGVTQVTLHTASLKTPAGSADQIYANRVSAFKENYNVEEIPVS